MTQWARKGERYNITSNSNFLSFQGPNCVICVLARCWAEKGPLTTKKKRNESLLDYCLDIRWVAFLLCICRWAHRSYCKKKKVTSDIPTQNKSDNYGSITLRKQQLMLLTMHLCCRIVLTLETILVCIICVLFWKDLCTPRMFFY